MGGGGLFRRCRQSPLRRVLPVRRCRQSPLRRVLPVRRGRRGCRPGIKGAGPRGPTRGDQEQWEFPDVELEEWEKKLIVAEVLSLRVGFYFFFVAAAIFHERFRLK